MKLDTLIKLTQQASGLFVESGVLRDDAAQRVIYVIANPVSTVELRRAGNVGTGLRMLNREFIVVDEDIEDVIRMIDSALTRNRDGLL